MSDLDQTPDSKRTHARGGMPVKLTEADIDRVVEALRQTGGIKAAAAKILKVARSTLYRFMDQHPEVWDAAQEIDEETLDLAESKVILAIKGGDMATVRWFLELKAGVRGYSRQMKVTGPTGGAIQTETLDVTGLSMAALKELREARDRISDERSTPAE